MRHEDVLSKWMRPLALSTSSLKTELKDKYEMHQFSFTSVIYRQMRLVTDRRRKYSVKGFFLTVCILIVITGSSYVIHKVHSSGLWASTSQWMGYNDPIGSARIGRQGLIKRDLEVWS